MVRLHFQCLWCPTKLGFAVSHEHLGRRYELTCPDCKKVLPVSIPLNTLELAVVGRERGMFDDTLDNFDVLLERLKKGKKY